MRFQFVLALAATAAAAPAMLSGGDGTLVQHIGMLPQQLDNVAAAVSKYTAAAKFDPVDDAADKFTDSLADVVKAANASPKLSAADAKAVAAALVTAEKHLKPAFQAISSKKPDFAKTKNAAHIKEDIESTGNSFKSLITTINSKGGSVTEVGNLIAADVSAALKVY